MSTPTPLYPRAPFARRFLYPVILSVILWLFIYFLNAVPIQIMNLALYRAYKNSTLLLFYLSFIIVGGGLVYPFMYFQGAGPRERLLAALITPVAYILSEMIRVSDYFSLGESIYYGLSSMGMFVFFLNTGLLGLSEMACRLIARRQTGRPIRVVTFWPIASLVWTIISTYIVLFWDMGERYFYFYQEGYKILFP